jgi:hypothetical protein
MKSFSSLSRASLIRWIPGAPFHMSSKAGWGMVVGLALLFGQIQEAQALKIKATFDPGDFNDTELLVLKDAVAEWAALLPCSDGMSVSINFSCDNLASSVLGLTTTYFTSKGYVDHATVQMHNDALNWTMGDPVNGAYDALWVAKHEVGHALGFIDGGLFKDTYVVKDGKTFFDMNNDGSYTEGTDFRLTDGDPSHAFSSSDLMYPYVSDDGRRLHPTRADALVLGKAYGYCVAPDGGATWFLLSLALVGALGMRKSDALV